VAPVAEKAGALLQPMGPEPMNSAPAGFPDPTRLVICIIALSFLLHAALAAVMGFTIDETYDVDMSRKLALSYQDHPPAIMLLIAAAVRLAGTENHLIVRLPTMLLSAAQSWLLYRLTAFVFDQRAGLFAVLGLCLSPLFGIYIGTFAITDGPLLFALTAAALFLARALFTKEPMSWRDWLLAGLFFGLALLSKFSAILVLPGVMLFLVTVPRHRRLLLTPAPYVAALVALAVFTPVIVWNLENRLDAFVYQGSRAALGGGLHVDRLLIHLAIIGGVTGPAAWVAQIAGLAGALRTGPRDEGRWFFAMLAIVPIGFFLALDLLGTIGVEGFNWPAPGYLFTFPLLGTVVAGWYARFPRAVWWTIVSCAVSASVLTLAYCTETLVGWMERFVPAANANYDPIVADFTDWRNLRTTLDARGLLDSKHFILAGRYEFCFKAQLVLKDKVPVVCLSNNPVALSLWRDDAALLGRDGIIITNWWNWRQPISELEAKFENVEELAPLWLMNHGRPVMRVQLALGHNLQHRLFEHPANGRSAKAAPP
jgi:hypothetical protein